MVKCAVPNCKYDSRRHNKTQNNITFHRFPKSCEVAWMNAINKTNWEPSSKNYICSIHFQPSCFVETKSGLRKLVENSVPELYLDIQPSGRENSGILRKRLTRVRRGDTREYSKKQLIALAKGKSSDEAYSKALATGVKSIIARVYKFFKREHDYLSKNYGPVLDIASFSNYKERTAEATGFQIEVVSRALREIGIRDGCPKKRRVEGDGESDTDCQDSIATETGDSNHLTKKSDHSYAQGYKTASSNTTVDRSDETFVIYGIQPKPARKISIKVEEEKRYEELPVMRAISDNSKDPLNIQTDTRSAETQKQMTVKRKPLQRETQKLGKTEQFTHSRIVLKEEEIDIGAEEIG